MRSTARLITVVLRRVASLLSPGEPSISEQVYPLSDSQALGRITRTIVFKLLRNIHSVFSVCPHITSV